MRVLVIDLPKRPCPEVRIRHIGMVSVRTCRLLLLFQISGGSRISQAAKGKHNHQFGYHATMYWRNSPMAFS